MFTQARQFQKIDSMRRNRIFAGAILVMLGMAQPVAMLCQENSAPETYEGEALCRNRRGVFPHPIFQPAPEYDDKARKKKIEGTVTLSIIVTKEGQTADIRVINGLTPGLDQQAIKAVSRWRFEPAVQEGKPCPMRINVQAQFRLY
jgi:TonB family protein